MATINERPEIDINKVKGVLVDGNWIKVIPGSATLLPFMQVTDGLTVHPNRGVIVKFRPDSPMSAWVYVMYENIKGWNVIE